MVWVYMFDETPAISPPIASFVIGPNFFKMPERHIEENLGC